MANSINDRAKNAEIKCAAVEVTCDGSAGGAMVSTQVIPDGATIVGLYCKTDDDSALGGTSPTVRVAVGGATNWICAATADPATVAIAIAGAGAGGFSGAVHVTIGGTPDAGSYYLSVCYLAGQ